jgi:hypothetical protein
MIVPFLGSLLASELPTISSWSFLETESPTVQCAADGTPWCASEMVVTCDVPYLEGLLKDFSQYPTTFPRVVSANELSPNIVHILVDMPFPLSPRDYVANFRREQLDNGVHFWWTSVIHPEAKEKQEVVRLPNSAGSWTVKSVSDGKSSVRYFWNAEIGLDIPEWALPRVRRTQGQEVMFWLQEACDRSK